MRLQKFFEQGEFGEGPGRIAYVLKLDIMPQPQQGMTWRTDPSFNAAEAILNDPGLKDVFKTAIANGYAIVAPVASTSLAAAMDKRQRP